MGKTSKDKRDIYYRRAKEQGFRARSAFKLVQIDTHFQLLDGVTRVVDLCAAPGGWSQVIAQKLRPTGDGVHDPRIIAVDLMEMAPLPSVHMLQMDITHSVTCDTILDLLSGHKAQLVVSDGAPDVLGLHDLDEYLQAQLVYAALDLAIQILEPNGAFVAKIFRGQFVNDLYRSLCKYFSSVKCVKPQASRNSSMESFVVCQGFREVPLADDNRNHVEAEEVEDSRGVCDEVIFIGAKDQAGWDADQSYPLNSELGEYAHQEPLQKPINPPYASALQKTKLDA